MEIPIRGLLSVRIDSCVPTRPRESAEASRALQNENFRHVVTLTPYLTYRRESKIKKRPIDTYVQIEKVGECLYIDIHDLLDCLSSLMEKTCVRLALTTPYTGSR